MRMHVRRAVSMFRISFAPGTNVPEPGESRLSRGEIMVVRVNEG